MTMLALIALVLILLVIAYFAITFFIIPHQLITFYRKQNIPMYYSPVIGSFNKDLYNVKHKGDYYADYNELAQREPRPKAIGKNIGNRVQLYLIDPEAIRQFFINHEQYIKDPFLNAMTKILSRNGLVLSKGKIWRQHRKLISSGFQFEILKDLILDIIEHSTELINKFKDRPLQDIPILDYCKATAGEVIGRIFFGESLGQYTMQGIPMTLFLANLLSRITSEPYNPLYLMFGMPLVKMRLVPRQRKLINDIMEFRSWCRDIVRRSMQQRKSEYEKQRGGSRDASSPISNASTFDTAPTSPKEGYEGSKPVHPQSQQQAKEHKGRKNMFDLFFEYQLINPNEPLSEDELVDEYITFFSDGVYTTGHFISMVTYYLEVNPEWKTKIKEEMESLFKNIEDITFDGLAKMDILNACMKETMRLAPPVVTAIERIALQDHDLAGIKVKKNTVLVACHCANHLDPRFHDDPTKFNPDRWLKPSKTQDCIKAQPSVFVPFSLGARHCIGQNFAMNEAKVILTILFKKFKYELVDKTYKLRFTQRFLREPLDPIRYNLYPIEP